MNLLNLGFFFKLDSRLGQFFLLSNQLCLHLLLLGPDITQLRLCLLLLGLGITQLRLCLLLPFFLTDKFALTFLLLLAPTNRLLEIFHLFL